MNIRRVACIESELMRCERELRGLLVDTRRLCVSQGDAEDSLPNGVEDPPSDVPGHERSDMRDKWSQIVSFFQNLPSFVEADNELQESQRESLKTFRFSVREHISVKFGNCAYLRLTYGSGAYYLLLLPNGITCRRFKWNNVCENLAKTYEPRDKWRTLTSIPGECDDFSGPLSVQHIVKDVLDGCYLHVISSDLAARLVQKFE